MPKLLPFICCFVLSVCTAVAQQIPDPYGQIGTPGQDPTRDLSKAETEREFKRNASDLEKREGLINQVAVGWTIEQLVQTAGKPDRLAHSLVGDHYEGIATYDVRDGMVIIRTRDSYVTQVQRITTSGANSQVEATPPKDTLIQLEAAIRDYGGYVPYKAFAVARGSSGALAWGWASEQTAPEDAAQLALAHCRAELANYRVDRDCTILAMGNEILYPISDLFTPIERLGAPSQPPPEIEWMSQPQYQGESDTNAGPFRPANPPTQFAHLGVGAVSGPTNVISRSVGPFAYSTANTSSGETFSTSSQRIGPFTYSTTSGSNGYASSSTRQRLGQFDYLNGTSTYGSYFGSTQHIGAFGFTTLTTPWGIWNGTSQTIGPFTFGTFYGPNGELMSSTTQTIGTQTYTTITPP